MPSERQKQLTLLAFVALVLFAGGNAVAVKFALKEMPPFWGAALRFALAAAVFFILMAIRRTPLPAGRALAGAVAYGLVGFGVSFSSIYWGLQQASAGTAGLMLAFGPLLTMFLAAAHGLESLSLRGLLGSFIAIAGMAVVFGDQLDANVPLSSLLAFTLGIAALAETGVLVKLIPQIHFAARNAVGMAAASLMLLAISLAVGERLLLPSRSETWLATAYLVFLGSVAVFSLYLFVLKTWTASATSYEFVLIPFVTVGLGVWLLDEKVTIAFAGGAVLVLAGVYIGALSGKKEAPPAALPVASTACAPIQREDLAS